MHGSLVQLEDFVVGEHNRHVIRSLIHMLREPTGQSAYVSGAPGVGKTALLKLLWRLARKTGLNCQLMSSEQFAADAYLSVRLSHVETTRARYQRIDLLCLDDVDLLRRKESMQVELAVIAEAIKSRGGKVIACSAKSLAELSAFHPDFLASYSLAPR